MYVKSAHCTCLQIYGLDYDEVVEHFQSRFESFRKTRRSSTYTCTIIRLSFKLIQFDLQIEHKL